MQYIVENETYNLSYEELKEQYTLFCEMSDDEFKENIKDALHLACIICYLKEVPTYLCLSDKGIIHELAHLLNGEEGTETSLNEIRERFERVLKLS